MKAETLKYPTAMKLHPFSPTSQECSVFADISYTRDLLSLTYELPKLNSSIEDLHAPQKLSVKDWKRKSDLWKTTCFEAFWSIPGSEKYWEFNFSPLGFWNVYSFESYRQPQPPKESFEYHILDVRCTETDFQVKLSHPLIQTEIEASLCAVVRLGSGELGYFSHKHAGKKPDFHLRESFSLKRPLL